MGIFSSSKYRVKLFSAIVFIVVGVIFISNIKIVEYFDAIEIELKNAKQPAIYQVFFDVGDGFSENNSSRQSTISAFDNSGKNLFLRLNLPAKIIKKIRIDPGDEVGFQEITSISLVKNGEKFYSWHSDEIIRDFFPQHDIGDFTKKGNSVFIEISGPDPFFCSGNDISKLYPIRNPLNIFIRIILFLILLLCTIGIIFIENINFFVFEKVLRFKYIGLTVSGTLLFLIGVSVYWKFLSFQQLFVYTDVGSDCLHSFWPSFVHLSKYIYSYGLPQWSFNVGLGQNIFPSYLKDPFGLIAVLSGKSNVSYSIGYIQFIKVVSAGVFFYLYLRVMAISRYPSIVGGILYAFCGHMIVRGGWYGYSTEGVVVAFALFSFEMYLKKNEWKFLPVSICFLLTSHGAFYAYIYTILFFSYSFFRYLCEKEIIFRRILKFYFSLFKIYFFGLIMSSIFLLPEVYTLLQSPRVGGADSHLSSLFKTPIFALNTPIVFLTSFFRLLSSDLFGTGTLYKGYHNYLEAPVFYCGLIVPLLLPQIFSFISKKQKILYSAALALVGIYITFPFFRYFLNGFSGRYYKTSSFWVSIVLVFISIQALYHIFKNRWIDVKLLVFTTVFLVWSIFLFNLVLNNFGSGMIDGVILKRIVELILFYTIALGLLKFQRLRNYAAIALLIVISLEAILFSYNTVNNRKVVPASYLKSKNGYMDYSNDAILYIKSIDNDFYRIEKNYNSDFLNDALFQDYYGTKSYNAFNNASYLSFIRALNVPLYNNTSSYIKGFSDRIILNSLVGVRYFLSKKEISYYGYKYLKTFGDVYLYKNEKYLPLGFLYDTYITYNDFMNISYEKRDEILLKAFVLENGQKEPSAYKRLTNEKILEWQSTLSDTNGDIYEQTSEPCKEYSRDIENLKTDSLLITNHRQNKIEGKIKSSSKRLLFLSIPYDRGWSLKVDGVKAELLKVNIGFMGININEGNHEIELIYRSPWLRTGMSLSLISLVLFVFFVIIDGYKNKGKKLTKI